MPNASLPPVRRVCLNLGEAGGRFPLRKACLGGKSFWLNEFWLGGSLPRVPEKTSIRIPCAPAICLFGWHKLPPICLKATPFLSDELQANKWLRPYILKLP